jgi:hypothetical protein
MSAMPNEAERQTLNECSQQIHSLLETRPRLEHAGALFDAYLDATSVGSF